MSRAKNNLRALVDELYARSANRIVPLFAVAEQGASGDVTYMGSSMFIAVQVA